MATNGSSGGRIGRSIWAIVAGFIVVVILSLGTDQLLHLLKAYPPWSQVMSDRQFMLATAYRVACSILGSYITARLAPIRPMRHALVGGAIGLLLSIAGAAASWSHPELGPHWYPLALVVTAMPCAWLGGKLCESRFSTSKAAVAR